MQSWTRVQVIILVAVLLFVGSCSSATPTSPLSPLATPTVEPTSTGTEPATATPQPPVALLEGLPFSLDEPLTAGSTQVSGTGPVGVPIIISDLTLMGEVLGRGTVGSDGLFDIELGTPLVVNHRIGILLDGESTEFEFTQPILDELETSFKGDEAISLPRIGAAFDAASVVP